MKKIILAILLMCGMASATTTVSGHIGNLGTSGVSNSFVRFWLRGCNGNQPRVSGAFVIAPSQGGVFYFDLPSDASGNITGTLYSNRDNTGSGNGEIECGGSLQATWYGMQVAFAGKFGPEIPVLAKSGVGLDVTNVTPLTSNPVVTPPTGDSTYCRIDGGNCGFTGPPTAPTAAAGDASTKLATTAFFAAPGPIGSGTANSGAFTTLHLTNQFTSTASLCAPVDGVLQGACYANLASAIASSDCPATGCTIDMRSPGSSHALGTVNPGTKVIKITEGPFSSYTADHIFCTAGLKLGGATELGFGGNTTITSVGSNSQPLIVFTQSNGYSTSCQISDTEFIGASGNSSQIGFFGDVSTLTGSAVENTELHHVTFAGFNGGGIEFSGSPTSASSAIQLLRMVDVTVFGGVSQVAPSFKTIGYLGQILCDTCFFNSINTQDAMYLGPVPTTGTFTMSGSQFHNLTLQGVSGGVCGHFGGVDGVEIDGGFIEGCGTEFSVTDDSIATGAASNNGVIIKNTFNPGTAGGTAVLTDTDNNSFVDFEENTIFGTPGAFINGSSAARVEYCHNYGPNSSTAGCFWMGPFKFGSIGSTVNAFLRGSGISLNSAFTSITAGTCQTQTLTLAGAATTGTASVNPSGALGTGFSIGSVWVTGTNTITVSMCSGTTGTPNVVTYNASVIQ